MKDFENLKYFLRIEVLKIKGGSSFVKESISLIFWLLWKVDCKPAETPIEVNHRLQIVEEATLVDKRQYQRTDGKLIYRELAYVVGFVSNLCTFHKYNTWRKFWVP